MVKKRPLVKQRLAELLGQAVIKAQEQGKLPALSLPEIILERPQNLGHGDYASSLPLKLARASGVAPLDIARAISAFIDPGAEIATVKVAPPGFINFTLSPKWLSNQVDAILEAGESYGDVDMGGGERVQIEFVSVNPTGPLHVGHGRGAVLGDTLANVLTSAGYRVEREYYINDAGNQVRAFFSSLYARYKQALGQDADMPSDGYMGAYMAELVKDIVKDEGDRYLSLAEEEAVAELGGVGLERMIGSIKADLELMGVEFDVWFSEQSLFDEGCYDKVMSLLKDGGHIAQKEGATWFTSTALGEDKDNVLVRGDGSPTYFASDIAYHYDKLVVRQFDRAIDIWGADHQGHVSRMKAVLAALGIAPERLRVLIAQLVTLRRGKTLVKISKRSGDIITLREVIDEVGKDACRYFFISRSADSQMDFDLELAKKQSADNPVYYVQYAHARIASILKLAEGKGIDYSGGDVSLLTTETELALIRKTLLLPEIIELAAANLESHHLAYYAQDLATVFHSFYTKCRVVSEDEALTRARLKLVAAAKQVLAKTLHLMGMTAPDTM